jgi:hypothetical protein
MFGTKFYFGSIRKYVALFGTLFNDITIDRVDPTTGDTINTLAVPLSYGPRDRYLARIRENPDLLREINQILPRMSFEIKNIEYDSDRKLNTIGRNTKVFANTTGNSMYSQYNPVPYNFNITLSILARNSDDATRIVEQILPFFKPEWTTTINLIPDMGIKMDIPVVLRNIRYEDTYEGSFTERYAITWDLDFVLKGYIYGPIRTIGVIKEIDINFYTPSTNTAAEGVGISPRMEYIVTTPGLDANGNPTSNASISIPLSEIQANSNYGYIVDFFSNVD